MTLVNIVRYSDGIVMASDLRTTGKDSQVGYETKINYTSGLMWAFAGTADERVFKKVSEEIKKIGDDPDKKEALGIIEELLLNVDSRLQKAAASNGSTPEHQFRMRGIFGVLYKNEFGIWLYDGSRLSEHDRETMVISEEAVGAGMRGYKIKDYQQARRWALMGVKVAIKYHPETYGGIEAFQMKRDGVVRRASLKGFKHFNNQTLDS